MEFKNMGTYDGGVISSSPATAMASPLFFHSLPRSQQ